MRIYLIRHGSTAGNLEHRYVGTTDEPLTEDAEKQLKKARGSYPVPDAVFASPRLRCIQTARLLFPEAEIRVLPGLEECAFGEFEYRNYQELQHDGRYQAWIDSGGTLAFPGGESREEFAARCCGAFQKGCLQALRQDCESAAFVVHGGTIMAVLDRFSQPHKDYFEWQVKNAEGFAGVAEMEGEDWKISCIKALGREADRAPVSRAQTAAAEPPVGIEDLYVMKQNKKLRCGYTTGSCAAAAAKAAAQMLLTGRGCRRVELMTPKGVLLHLPTVDRQIGPDWASCAVRKFAGDDPDATDGILVYARAELVPGMGNEGERPGQSGMEKKGERSEQSGMGKKGERSGQPGMGNEGERPGQPGMRNEGERSEQSGMRNEGERPGQPDMRNEGERSEQSGMRDEGERSGQPDMRNEGERPGQSGMGEQAGSQRILIDGGVGVGRVTKPGLEQPVGAAAINRVPRQMIAQAVEEVCEMQEYHGRMKIVVSVPEGEAIAEKTFNPHIGILGGISILGTSGIVVPMSEEALIASIRLEMKQKYENGERLLLITPGNYGADFLRKKELSHALDVEHSMKCSNYVGETVDMAVELGFDGILFVAHIGKFIKVSGGIMNTHSAHADCRAELIAAQMLRAAQRQACGAAEQICGGAGTAADKQACGAAEQIRSGAGTAADKQACGAAEQIRSGAGTVADKQTCGAAAGTAAGYTPACAALAGRLLATNTTEEAVELLREAGMLEATMREVTQRIKFHLQKRCRGAIRTEAVIYSNQSGYLGETDGAEAMMEQIAAWGDGPDR